MQKKLFLLFILTTVCTTNIFAMNQKVPLKPRQLKQLKMYMSMTPNQREQKLKEVKENIRYMIEQALIEIATCYNQAQEVFDTQDRKLFSQEFNYFKSKNRAFNNFIARLQQADSIEIINNHPTQDLQQLLTALESMYEQFCMILENYKKKLQTLI